MEGGSPAASDIPVPGEREEDPRLSAEELRDFRKFQKFMRQSGGESTRPGRARRDESEEDDDGRSGAPGPPPSWDGTGVFEDYMIKAQLWIATTKSKPKMRGPLLLKALTSTPFETFKHYAQDKAWLADPQGAERLLEDMNRPEHYGDDRQEHMLAAMSRITFHLKRQRGEHWRDFFARWETAQRKVHEHKIHLPEDYEGFLLINGLQLSDQEVKALLNYARRDISPASIKDWLRKSESKLTAQDLGSDKKKTASILLTENAPDHTHGTEYEVDHTENDELLELEATLNSLQGSDDITEDDVLDEKEAAEVLATMIQQKKKTTYSQSLQKKKDRELSRGYMAGRGSGNKVFQGEFKGKLSIEEVKRRTRCKACGQIGHWHRDAECPQKGSATAGSKPREAHHVRIQRENEAYFIGHLAVDQAGPSSGSMTTEKTENLGSHPTAFCDEDDQRPEFLKDVTATEDYGGAIGSAHFPTMLV